jgi:hypothetical protein
VLECYGAGVGEGVGVGAATKVVAEPAPLLFAGLASAQAWPALITEVTVTLNWWSPVLLQITFQLRATLTAMLAGRLRFITVNVRAFVGEKQSAGSVSVKVALTRMEPAGPLLWRAAIAETMNCTPAVVV